MRQWDRDIGWARAFLWGMAGGNGIVAGMNAWRHLWLNFAAGVIWTLNMLVMLRLTHLLQESRDRMRVLMAAIREELERR